MTSKRIGAWIANCLLISLALSIDNVTAASKCNCVWNLRTYLWKEMCVRKREKIKHFLKMVAEKEETESVCLRQIVSECVRM